ncbi:phenylalanine--tRNA ligase subunit beta [Clostridium folliculivorans]|uniref:Phenylalanine--tRNA ligase beta subunit n=1 Tax=Clostridium folliculivorans TaxID=2886038 RepID=A0A9W5XZK3_9CLOT|nr:phenylalanine--tRNA ligase subunit beta [Clostridium folliculivorans]GKU23931.1 phenylalanine--tRNA ligase beta subunit [Clostridium folliculivorans]GKU30046.1 phenylalanine--tRNA ligase beta subunit [Clostridium folliculivorans]
MKVPYLWLKDYVNIDIDAKELADRLTLSGSKVEEVITSGEDITNVVTGKLLKIEPHPDAEKLVICQVEVGQEEPVQIVTGAKNMKENDIVPVALHGSTLPNGLKIKKGKLRGVVSNGMMCSEEELGIAGDEPVHGLMILPENTPLGKDIKDVLGLNKAVIDFEITSNRPDCLSVLGIARETAATLGIEYKNPSVEYKTSGTGNVEDVVKVEVRDALCKRYMARAVKDIKIEPSPTWMQERLLEAGVRPINNVVDITNFVMLELGQPMHAFDKREIKSNKIVVERAKENEKFVTLDEIERNLDTEVLCIKDGEETIGLAGIMGGLQSGIKDDTTEIIFESASFDGTNIRVNSKKLNLRTEASSRFEKDIDPNLTELALNRACALIEELKVGTIVEGTIDIYNERKEPHTMTVDSNWVNKFLGTDISKEQMKEYLDRLELKTTIENDNLVIDVPTFRIDIAIKEDIAEEVARIYGYNNVPMTVIGANSPKDAKNKKLKLDDLVINTMISSGLNQSISYSFVSPKVFDMINLPSDSELRNVVKIKNPLGEDYSLMRTSTLPSMMECLGRNYSRSNEFARLFELGKVYIPKADENQLPNEKNILTIGLYGAVDYLDLKGVVENLIDALAIKNPSFKRQSENVSYHPGKTAELFIGKEKVGVLGEIHPDVADNYGIDTNAYVAELDLDILYANSNTEKKYKPLPKYPAVTRDIALLVEDAILVQEIEETIRKAGGNLVETVKLFDVYKGQQIPEGKKSIAYAISYRDENKTLTDNEVNKVHDKILRSLEYKIGAQLR